MFTWITPVLFFARKWPTPSVSPPPVLKTLQSLKS